MSKSDLIKDYILKYIFGRGRYEFIEDPKYDLYMAILDKVEKERGGIFFNEMEFYNAFDELVNNSEIEIVYNDNVSIIKQGTIELRNPIKVREYLLRKGFIGLKEAYEYTDRKYLESQKMFAIQMKEMKKTKFDLNAQKEELLEKIKEQENQIKNFYNNILAILGILVAVFSIIGFNIGGIKFILGSEEKLQPWVYAGSIGVINLCIVISMYLLFWLVNRVINKSEDRKGTFSNKVVIGLFCILIIIIVICFAVA